MRPLVVVGRGNLAEKKVVKNRAHVDLTAPGDREMEIDRLIGLGAKRLADKDEYGQRWTVLADPEGNEFCVASTASAHSTDA